MWLVQSSGRCSASCLRCGNSGADVCAVAHVTVCLMAVRCTWTSHMSGSLRPKVARALFSQRVQAPSVLGCVVVLRSQAWGALRCAYILTEHRPPCSLGFGLEHFGIHLVFITYCRSSHTGRV